MAGDGSTADPGEAVDDGARHGSRRSFLAKGAVGAAAVWTAPIVLSTTASAGGSTLVEITSIQNNRGQNGFGDVEVGVSGEGANAQIAYVFTPLDGTDDITVTPQAGGGTAWTPLITAYLSLDTVPGTTSTPSTAARLRLDVFYRIGTVTSNVVVNLAGSTGLAGIWRAGVASFANVVSIGAGGAVAAVGGGNAANSVVPGPAVNTTATDALVFFAGAKANQGFLSSSPGAYFTLESNNNPPSYAAFANTAPGLNVPATSFTTTGTGAQRVGFQVIVAG